MTGSARAARPRRSRRARPVPVVQGMRPRLPDRRRHGDLQGGVAAPEVRRQARPRSHYALGRLPRWLRMSWQIAPLSNALMRHGVATGAMFAALAGFRGGTILADRVARLRVATNRC